MSDALTSKRLIGVLSLMTAVVVFATLPDGLHGAALPLPLAPGHTWARRM